MKDITRIQMPRAFLHPAAVTGFWLAVVTALAYWAYAPLLPGGLIPVHDPWQIIRLLQIDKCFHDGQIPCRWTPDMGLGYGYPFFNYYPPLPYYVGELFRWAGMSYIDTVDVLQGIPIVLSAWLMFLFVRSLWGTPAGIVAAAFYVYGPYRAVDMFVRGAVAEHWALIWLPGILWAEYHAIRDRSWRWAWLFALFVAFLLMSHVPLAIAFIPLATAWAVLQLLLSMKVGPRLRPSLQTALRLGKQAAAPTLHLGVGALLSLGLAAFFIGPMSLERGLVREEGLITGYFDYRIHFATLGQLFISRFWGFGSSLPPGQADEMSFQIGWLHWGIALPALALLIWLWRQKRWLPFWTLAFFTFGLALYAYMVNSSSGWLWKLYPPLAWLQFPWRLLGIVILAAAAVAGGVVGALRARPWLPWLAALTLVPMVIAFNVDFFYPQNRLRTTDAEAFSGKSWEDLRNAAYPDYVPVYNITHPPAQAGEPATIIEGAGTILYARIRSNSVRVELEAETEVQVQLSVFYFPNWRVRLDGLPIPEDHSNAYGFITFRVPPGHHTAEARLHNTMVRSASNFVSLLSWVFLVGAALAYLPPLSYWLRRLARLLWSPHRRSS